MLKALREIISGFTSGPDVEIVLGDICHQEVDAVVNAADNTLAGGTGVDGALRAAAGPELSEACRQIGRLNGRAVATPGYALPAQMVVHVAAPVHFKGARIKDLAAVFLAAAIEADRNGAQSIAFPMLGAGAFGWPVEDVVEAARHATQSMARKAPGIQKVRMVAFSQRDAGVLQTTFGVQATNQSPETGLLYHPGHL